MKKTLLSIFSATALISSAFAQCTPDPAYASASYGFFPDSITFLTTGSAEAGLDYDAVIDFKSFVDTTVSVTSPFPITVNVKLDAFRVNGISGLPSGFSYAEGGVAFNSGMGYWENTYGIPNDPSTLSAIQGCLSLTASASDVSAAAPVSGYTDYPLVAEVDARVADNDALPSINGSWMSELSSFGVTPIYIEDYVVRVHAATTVGIVDRSDLSGVHVFPNPSTGIFNLSFDNLGEDISVVVYDNQGREMMSNVFFANTGLATLDMSGFSTGVYAISVQGTEMNTVKRVVLK